MEGRQDATIFFQEKKLRKNFQKRPLWKSEICFDLILFCFVPVPGGAQELHLALFNGITPGRSWKTICSVRI